MARIDDHGPAPMLSRILVPLQPPHVQFGQGSRAIVGSFFARGSIEVLKPKYNQEGSRRGRRDLQEDIMWWKSVRPPGPGRAGLLSPLQHQRNIRFRPQSSGGNIQPQLQYYMRGFFAHRDPFISDLSLLAFVKTYPRLAAGELNPDFAAKDLVFGKFINSTPRLAWSDDVDKSVAPFLSDRCGVAMEDFVSS